MNPSSPRSARFGRRPLLVAAASGGIAVGGLAAASRTGLLGDGTTADSRGVLQLSDTGDGVQSLALPLGEDNLPAVGPGRWRTANLPTTTHSMVAVTWQRGDTQPIIEISSRRNGAWQAWKRLPPLHDLPDLNGPEGNGRAGTDLAWIGQADGVQVRLRGDRPNDLMLVLLHPSTTPLLRQAPLSRRLVRNDIKPVLLTRRDWGANPDWRDGAPSFNETIQQVHVHHTVNSNDYAADDVPGLIRGMYRYHTSNLGWSDIAYNFLVDRFGRTWVGRAGGPDRPVRGAHTLGFNATSTGIAAIGNYDTLRPTDSVLTSIANLAAWKLASYERDPAGRVVVRSEGSDRYRTGAQPQLPVIDGHRDTNDTACPGAHLYAALPAIRARAKQRLDGTDATQIVAEPVLRGGLVVDRTLRVDPGRAEPPTAHTTFQWLRDGATIAGATATSYRATTSDVGSLLSVVVTYTANRFEPAQRTLTASGPVRAVPTIQIDAVSSRRGVIVTVSVTAPGAQSAPTGTVIVELPKRQRSTVMTDGQVRVRFRHPAASPRRVLVRYAGNAEILSGSAETTKVVTNAEKRR